MVLLAPNVGLGRVGESWAQLGNEWCIVQRIDDGGVGASKGCAWKCGLVGII